MAGHSPFPHASVRGRTHRLRVAFATALVLAMVGPALPAAADAPALGWQSIVPVYENSSCFCGPEAGEAIVADPTGWATAAFAMEDVESSTWRLVAVRINLATGAMDEPVNISHTAGSPIGIQLAADEKGNVLAVWIESDSSSGMNYSLFSPGVGWSLPAHVYPGTFTNAFLRSLSMNADGRALVVWAYTDFADGADIWAADFSVDSGWTTPQKVRSSVSPFYESPQARIDDSGGALLVYATGANLTAVHRSATGAWGANETVTVAGHSISDFSVAVGANGGALLAWMEFSNENNATMQASVFSTSAGWSAAKNLTWEGEGQGQLPHVGADAYGNYMVEWRQWHGRDGPIVAQRYSAAAGWEDRTTIAVVEFEGWTTSMVMDPLGNAYATWWQRNNSWFPPPVSGSTLDVMAAVYTNSVGWGPATIVGPRDADNDAPSIAADGRGNAVAMWSYAYGLHAQVYLGVPDTTPPALVLSGGGLPPTTNEPSFVVTGSVAAGDRVWVNGARVAIGPSGTFATAVNLSDGPNQIVVVARDPAGNAATSTLVVVRTNAPVGTPGGSSSALASTDVSLADGVSILVGLVVAALAAAGVFLTLSRLDGRKGRG